MFVSRNAVRTRSARENARRGDGRPGFTLIELLLALVLLDFGLVALVSASAAASRLRAKAQTNQRAIALASARIERMLAAPCHGDQGAVEQPTANIIERWTDTPLSHGARVVSDSVTIRDSRGTIGVALRAAGQC